MLSQMYFCFYRVTPAPVQFYVKSVFADPIEGIASLFPSQGFKFELKEWGIEHAVFMCVCILKRSVIADHGVPNVSPLPRHQATAGPQPTQWSDPQPTQWSDPQPTRSLDRCVQLTFDWKILSLFVCVYSYVGWVI